MKKAIIFGFLTALFSINANAQYVRKIKEPNFFIPESAQMHKAEKLPEIKMKAKEEIKKDTNAKAKDDVNVSEHADKSLYDIKGVPDYKNKYNEYLSDIIAFYNTGKMPENAKLDNDLAAMTSDEKTEITAAAPQKITSKELGEFYGLYKKALND